MTSEEFARAYPRLTEKQAERLVRDHGLDPAEARKDLGPTRFTTTAELFGWLGY
ncbi:hypothetical protein [Paracoccus sulfuroxidans]|uniref:Uncharacterized protein n=1 Tax=Paracoccus sulfuroxidans TaxID=384678 RepID=A0A562N7Y8_9RHOB|nr:hypothetical protein [Paracoccus sulfuroxidans]TWI28198.1 hypothetical protein IQ24_03815 [Paracoccus sulfuroxidans]